MPALCSMHWVLDVMYRESDIRTRERTQGYNLSLRRRLAVKLLKRHPIVDCERGSRFVEGLLPVEDS